MSLLGRARVRYVEEVRENREYLEERTRWARSFPPRTGGVLRAKREASTRRRQRQQGVCPSISPSHKQLRLAPLDDLELEPVSLHEVV